MNKRERILAAVRGEAVDRVPIALWRHFPYVDQTAEGLAQAVIAFQEAYDFDLVKVTHTSGYMAEAWGARLSHLGNDEGTRQYVRRPIHRPEDWHELRPLRVGEGILGRELAALSLIRRALGSEPFLLPTLFSPLTVAKQLAGDLWLTHLREDPAALEAGLRTIAESCVAFGQACLQHGADGLFFATQLARYDVLDVSTYERFGLRYDLAVLEALRPASQLLLLHLHGQNPLFELVSRYQPDIVNWHDRETSPDLVEGLRRLPRGAVSGGLDRHGPIHVGSPAETAAQVVDTVRRVGGRRLVISTGCVLLTTSPPANIAAARQAVATLTAT